MLKVLISLFLDWHSLFFLNLAVPAGNKEIKVVPGQKRLGTTELKYICTTFSGLIFFNVLRSIFRPAVDMFVQGQMKVMILGPFQKNDFTESTFLEQVERFYAKNPSPILQSRDCHTDQ